ncbi:MAG: type II toxin-antitoxin system PemK/MazF family toxin [Burkholderiaceae bacterium]
MANAATSAEQPKPFDIVVVPFPFTDRNSSKRRPALVLSSAGFNQATGHSVLAMITSADQSSWLGDLTISILRPTGLPQPCLVRMKLFTLDRRLIVRIAGNLSQGDRKRLKASWADLLAIS